MSRSSSSGFLIALILAWAFELTPEGIKRTEEVAPERIDRALQRAKVDGVHRESRRSSRPSCSRFNFLTESLAALRQREARYRGRRAGAIPEKSIAVLPFENLSEDKANAYFASGIQDEILTRLAKIADLKVISRTSTQQYQSKPGNICRNRAATGRGPHSRRQCAEGRRSRCASTCS